MSEKIEILNLKREDFASIAGEVLAQGRTLRFRAKGGSMSPLIRNEEVVKVVPVKGKINVGDVVLYRSPYGSALIHRVIQRGKESIITKGDFVASSDQPVLSKQVLGLVAAVEKNGWCIRLDRPTGRLLNIVLATISSLSFLTYPSFKFMKPVSFLVVPVLCRLFKF